MGYGTETAKVVSVFGEPLEHMAWSMGLILNSEVLGSHLGM